MGFFGWGFFQRDQMPNDNLMSSVLDTGTNASAYEFTHHLHLI